MEDPQLKNREENQSEQVEEVGTDHLRKVGVQSEGEQCVTGIRERENGPEANADVKWLRTFQNGQKT